MRSPRPTKGLSSQDKKSVFFVSIVLLYVLFVCKCVLYYCQRVATQLQLNISYHINIHWEVNFVLKYSFLFAGRSAFRIECRSQVRTYIVCD